MAEVFDVQEVISAEHEQLIDRRNELHLLLDTRAGNDQNPLYEAHRLRPFGVCLSGGGIRSATFNLGILQGLAERGLLPFIDYLSTVSGGGYIGTWLHGVILRKGGGKPGNIASLISPTKEEDGARRVPKEPGDATDDPVTFLRKYSNYLAPRLGLFSPDFWVIAVIWIRNMVLNQLILVPFLAGLVLLAILAGLTQQYEVPRLELAAVSALSFACLAGSVGIMIPNLRGIIQREFDRESSKPSPLEKTGMIWTCVVLVLISGLVLGTSTHDPIPGGLTDVGRWSNVHFLFLVFWALYLLLQGFGGFRKSYERLHATWRMLWLFHVLWIPPVCAAVTTVLMAEVLHWIASWKGGVACSWHMIAWGPPLVVLALMVGVTLLIGLMGADFPDSTREWLSRFGALLSTCCAAWMALFAIGVFGPKWFAELAMASSKVAGGLFGGWVATTAAGLVAGRSSKTDGEDPRQSNIVLEWIGKIAPTVFLVGYLLTVSMVVHVIIAHWANVYEAVELPAPPPVSGPIVDFVPTGSPTSQITLRIDTRNNAVPGWLAWLRPIDREYWRAYTINPAGQEGPLPAAPILLLACGLLVSILPLRININEFSLHHFYKNRLVRCYLGAGRAHDRRPNPFTGFDHRDDLRIAELRPRKPADWPDPWNPYFGPCPIVNTTLNLNAGSELATQERKGASFIFSSMHCGFDPPHSVKDSGHSGGLVKGYRNTRKFMYSPTESNFGGPLIGTAMGISGAAANPNGGYHTSAPLAFLMTIFDVRLGWWVGNPKKDHPSGRPGPRYALASLLSELFAQTTWHSNYLNLSDGGHFENLGLYELVRRRCRYIIVCDGEEDAALNFESLGGAIRKCRSDFGVEIDLDPKLIHAEGKPSKTHCVVGRVIYPEVTQPDPVDPCGRCTRRETGPTEGWILYLKASVTGDEPEDVVQYHATHPVFPHEPTTNQFFTESQFESYRRLGLHVVESVFEGVEEQISGLRVDKSHEQLSKIFRKLCQHWYPPTTVADGVSTRHTEAYSALIKRLSDDRELSYLDSQIIPRMALDALGDCQQVPVTPLAAPSDEAIRRKSTFYCLDLIQLMENVWVDLHLYERADRENPKNGGWMRMFQHWASQPIFQETWEQAGCTYNDLFREFYKGLTPPSA
jgi:hypothetical protein